MPKQKLKCDRCSKLFLGEEALIEHKKLAHPAMVNDQQLESAAKTALYEYLTSDGADRNLRDRASKGQGYLSSQARKEAAENNAIGMMIMAAREFSETKADFANVLKKALPDLPVVKAISAGRPS